MSDTQLTRAERLFAEAVELEPADQAGYVAAQCNDDDMLRAEVEQLLSAAKASEAYFSALPGRFGIDRLRNGTLDECRAAAGQVFGQYRLIRLIGSGGMGAVWLAERADGRFEGAVAVKLLTRPGSGEALASFDREAHYLAKLTHPNIARLLDAGVGPGDLPFLILEYVDGEPIDAWCDRHSQSIDRRLDLFLRVTDAVAHAHSRLIVHSDIKPSNVLVGEDGTVKLLDFGIATLLDGDLRNDAGRALTPEFASPEQLAGETISTATDVYSLGLLLFKLLTGSGLRHLDDPTALQNLRRESRLDPPSLASTLDESQDLAPDELRAIAAGRGVTPNRLLKTLRGELDPIVRKALAVEPGERYRTVDDFAADLRHYRRNEPVAAVPNSVEYRARKFVSRHRGGVLSAALTAIVLIGAAVVTTWQSIEARQQRDEALFQQRRVMATNQFLNLMLSELGPDGEALPLNELLDRGTALIDREFGSGTPFVAYTLYDISVLYATIGQLERQLALLERAETVARDDGDKRLLATVLCARARALHVSDPAASARYLAEGLEVLPANDSSDVADDLQCARAQGLALATAGDNADAARVFAAALARLDASDMASPDSRITLLNDLTEQYLNTGRNAEALASMDRVIAESERIGRGNTAAHVTYLANKGAVLTRVGEVRAAADVRREAFERVSKLEQPLIGVRLHFGASLVDLEQFDEAIRVLEPELEAADAGGNDRFAAQTAINIGMALSRSGQTAAGEAYLRRAEAVFRETPQAHARMLAMLDATRAEARLDEGDIEGARRAVATAFGWLDYPAAKAVAGLLPALLVAARTELAAGNAAAGLAYADTALEIASTAARDTRRSADVGKSLFIRARLRNALDDPAAASADIGDALVALEEGLGTAHPLVAEAREFQAGLTE
jgi:serine/threonine-protein kinase